MRRIMKELIIYILFIALSFWSSFPYLSKGILQYADDLNYHLLRIEGIKDSIIQGYLIPRINPNFLYGYGYAVDLFYPDFFIYIAAFLRLIGYSIITSYKIYIFILNLMTFIVTYLCAKPLTKSRLAGFMTAVLYTLSSYRLIDIYKRGALGEVLAFIFIPLAILGIYYVFYNDYRKWYILTIGMSGLLLSHIISSFMMFLIIIVFASFSIKKLFENKERIYFLILAGGMTFGMCVFFILPMLEQMISSDLFLEKVKVFELSKTALHPLELLWSTLKNSIWPPNVGLILVIIPMFRLLIGKYGSNKRGGDFFLVVGIVLLILTTNLTPWEYLQQTVLGSIQFPWRFLTFVTFSLSLAGGIYIVAFKNKKIVILMMFLTLVAVMILSLNSFQFVENTYPMITEKNQQLSPKYIGIGKEYLPINTSLDEIILRGDRVTSNRKDLLIKNYHKVGIKLTFDYTTGKNTKVTLPLIYYKGYSGVIYKDNQAQKVKLTPGNNHLITTNISGQGRLKVTYTGTMIQHISLIVSFLFFVIFVFLVVLNIKKRLP